MNFVQEFIEQQLSKNPSSQLLSHIQDCHSAVEDLVINLESLRTSPRTSVIQQRIERFSTFLSIRQDLLAILQSGSKSSPNWLLQMTGNSALLTALLASKPSLSSHMVQNTLRRVFLQDCSLQQLIEENQKISHCVSLLKQIQSHLDQGTSSLRQKVQEYDSLFGIIEEQQEVFQVRIDTFNCEVSRSLRQLQQFEANVLLQFEQLMSSS